MENNQMESIWADGIPNQIKEEDKLSDKDILDMCIRFTLEHVLKAKNYKIHKISDDINSIPNIVCSKDNVQYALAVVPCIFPYFMVDNVDLRKRYIADCKEQNSKPVLCPTMILSTDKERAKASLMLKGDLFNIYSLGQVILTSDENFTLTPTILKPIL